MRLCRYSMSISTLTQDIFNLRSLEPSPDANRAFSSLVQYIVENSNTSAIEAERIISESLNSRTHEKLIEICSQGEAELEKYWAFKILNGDYTLNDFPYYQNYLELTKREAALIEQFDSNWKDKKMVFIGGGAIPMTSIMLAQLYGIKSKVVDIDPMAVGMARDIIMHLGLSHLIEVELGSGETYNDYQGNNIVFIAALAGLNETTKTSIFVNIAKQISQKQLVITRSSWGLRQLLYRPVSIELLNSIGFELLHQYHPTDEVINSVLIFKKRYETRSQN